MTVITTLTLARHGEAHCNLAGVAGGDKTCTGLTERGRDQVQLLAARLRQEQEDGKGFDVLYCAPRRRVIETAQILGSALRLTAQVYPGLAGPRHGEADGRPWEQIMAEFGGTPQSSPGRPYATGSESWNQYLARLRGSLTQLIADHPGQHILIAGHHETIEAACTAFLDLPVGSSVRLGFASSHASLTRWAMHRTEPGQDQPSQDRWTLAAFNDTRHLP
jgi:2,3-bisphosphoglycerate-dependent phosphoglycerate mutase